jgi:putative lipoprotein (rSAM/lipoprotein system)
MKKLHSSLLRRLNSCIAFLLSLMGVGSFVSCFSEMYGIPPIDDVLPMYGTPSAEFSISGRVENKLQQGVPGIEISINEYGYAISLGATEEDGSFDFAIGGLFPDDEICIVARDIDSTENGSYKSDTIMIDVQYTRDPNNYWNNISHIENIVITLEEETDEPK